MRRRSPTAWNRSTARRYVIGIAIALLLSPLARPETPSEDVLEEVLVTGEQPGPAMWQVRKGNHTLWIVGTLTPLPAKMTWRSQQVEEVVKRSAEILGSSSLRGNVKGGWFGALRLLPSVMRVRDNTDGATLRQILPPDVYARWAAAHRKFFGKAPNAEDRWRPTFAARALFARALEKSGLSDRQQVWPSIERLARASKVRVRQREFRVSLADPKGLIAEVAATPRDKEIACLVATLDRVDSDLPNMQRRAEAWAKGDIQTLRALPYVDQQETCLEALLNGPRLRQLFEEQQQAMAEDWLAMANYLLLAYETSLTTLPMPELLGRNGALARLREQGYEIVEPPLNDG